MPQHAGDSARDRVRGAREDGNAAINATGEAKGGRSIANQEAPRDPPERTRNVCSPRPTRWPPTYTIARPRHEPDSESPSCTRPKANGQHLPASPKLMLRHLTCAAIAAKGLPQDVMSLNGKMIGRASSASVHPGLELRELPLQVLRL
jgi:hypothetical protein